MHSVKLNTLLPCTYASRRSRQLVRHSITPRSKHSTAARRRSDTTQAEHSLQALHVKRRRRDRDKSRHNQEAKMRYRSTRGVEDCGFVDAVLMGLAPDRGLLVPKEIPKVDAATLEKWSKLPFAALATEIISLYIDESEISRAELEQLTKTAYSNWRSEHVTPVHHLDGDYHLLELFHGGLLMRSRTSPYSSSAFYSN